MGDAAQPAMSDDVSGVAFWASMKPKPSAAKLAREAACFAAITARG